jgi:acyl-CoA reductase-like NAD-dependent aldehyde dehydrogenase
MSATEQRPVPIAGERVTTAESVEVTNPYSGDVVGHVPSCGEVEVSRACDHALEVLRRGDLALHRRAHVLDEASRLIAGRQEELARSIAIEAGKPIRTARVEAGRAVDTFAFAAAAARHLGGDLVPMEAASSGTSKLGFALRVPAGVLAAITPFNFPLTLVAHKLAPAIAAGCPVVLKPAPQTPLTALTLVELLVEAGLPDDWISVVTDHGKEAGAPLVEHPVPAVVSFTGSAPVGWSIAATAPRKRVLLELGSNSPLLVEPDADAEDVARRAAVAGFGYAGQSCISVQRLLVHRELHDELVSALAAAADGLVVGDPLDDSTDVGPLIRPEETERVRSWVQAAVDGGATIVTGGDLEGGLLRPTVVDAAPTSSDVFRREIFGPVVVVNSYRDLDEGIALANDSDFGLQAGIFTNDIGTALRAVRELDFGGVLVNEVPTARVDQQPYGGVRDAGNTREGPEYAIEEMTNLRFVSIQP